MIWLSSFLLFIPQAIVLQRILRLRPQLLHPGEKTHIQKAMLNPFSTIFKHFPIIRRQTISWVLFSNMFLHLTVLVPQHIVIISFLALWKIETLIIGCFVSGGAFFGSMAIGATFYYWLLRRIGIFGTARLLLLLQVTFLLN